MFTWLGHYLAVCTNAYILPGNDLSMCMLSVCPEGFRRSAYVAHLVDTAKRRFITFWIKTILFCFVMCDATNMTCLTFYNSNVIVPNIMGGGLLAATRIDTTSGILSLMFSICPWMCHSRLQFDWGGVAYNGKNRHCHWDTVFSQPFQYPNGGVKIEAVRFSLSPKIMVLSYMSYSVFKNTVTSTF